MKHISPWALVATITTTTLLSTACSTQNWYQGVQQTPVEECRSQPVGAARQDCEARVQKVPYDQFVKERDAAKGK